MTRDEARELLESEHLSTGDLAELIKFIFNVLDARQMLDNVPWKGMNQP